MPDWVFCTESGGPLDGDNLRHRVFYKLLEKAELRRVRFHDLRHTFASLLLQNRESPAYVKEQMGHSSIQVTVDVYGHLIPAQPSVRPYSSPRNTEPPKPSSISGVCRGCGGAQSTDHATADGVPFRFEITL